jgi:3-hydroxyisobutyrate dehydrogenase-like beta-hydroxyacid dehydrogenase
MSDVTAIGLGLMGAALARTIQRAGHELTVWNRSAEKMQPLLDAGARGADDFSGAIEASPVILICIDNYAVTNALLRSDTIAPLLEDKTIVQLSTGTSSEAADSAAWFKQRQVHYLAGAILAGPDQIGSDDAIIVLGGDPEAMRRAGPMLECLGRNRYLGENHRAASALDMAWLCDSYARFIAVSQAACICEAEGIDVAEFADLFGPKSYVRRYANVVHDQSYAQCTATLRVWHASLKRACQHGRDIGIDTRFLDLVDDYWDRAEKAGYGEEHGMALYKVMRES